MMALFANVLRLPPLGLSGLTRGRWAVLVITMWFLTWVMIEFEGGPSGQNLIRRMLISCVAHRPPKNPRFWKLNERIAVSGSIEI
jgi:hypothetical protein